MLPFCARHVILNKKEEDNLSFVTDRHRVELCPNSGLTVTWCGWQKCDSNHQYGPMFYKDYAITFVLHGYGKYSIDGKTFVLGPGTGFVIYPGVSTYYIADKDQPWEYIFAMFHGSDVPALLGSAGISREKPTFLFGNDAEYRQLLDEMCTAGRKASSLGYDVVGCFYRCVAPLVENNLHRTAGLNPVEQHVAKAVAYMEANYPYNISVSDVVEYVGVERTYFFRLFKKELGCGAQEWLIKLRLRHAVAMLLGTNYSVTEIACSVGFYDVSHFVKTFKRYHGCSPSEYRLKSCDTQAKE